MNGKKRMRRQRRPGTIGGKLPWNDWRSASSWRKTAQFPLLTINIYIGVTFYYWVRYFETAGTSVYIPRPGGIEGWLPIAGSMNIRYTLETGFPLSIHATSMLLLVMLILTSPLLKKAFYSWLYPVGTLSGLLGNLGKKVLGRNFTLPRWLDIPLLSLKHLLPSFFLHIALPMPARGIQYSLMSAYGMIIDVKMLDFFRHIGSATFIFVIAIGVLSLFIRNAWCRYLCPYGALFGLPPLFSPFKIHRSADSHIDYGKYAKNCPLNIPVDRLIQVRTVECTGCMTCVEPCPVASTLSFSLQIPSGAQGNGGKSLWRQRTLSDVAMTLLVLGILFVTIDYVVYANIWSTSVSDHMYFQLIPKAKVIGY